MVHCGAPALMLGRPLGARVLQAAQGLRVKGDAGQEHADGFLLERRERRREERLRGVLAPVE